MRKWFAVGLLCLCVLCYYGINNYGVKSKYQSALTEGTDVTLLARPRSVGRLASEVVLPVKEDASFPDHVDVDHIEVSRINDQAPVSEGEHLDPDVFDTTSPSHQKNIGMFLDVDGEPGDQTSPGPLPQRNVGTFLDVDGNDVDSGFFLSNESIEVNIGKFIDPDGLE
jgi:hypothetical protein